MTNNNQQALWYQKIAQVMPKQLALKSIGTTLFISLFLGAYFYLLKHTAYPITLMPTIWLDKLIGFQPSALPLYLSLWLYVALPPAFFATRHELYYYGLVMTLTCMTGLIIFYFWPTAAPLADIDWAHYPDMAFLKNMDAAGNACPSLHVTTAIFSGIWLNHLLSRFCTPSWIKAFNWLWCIGIIYSTIATRQHVAIDAIAGLILGGVTAYLSLPKRQLLNQPLRSTTP